MSTPLFISAADLAGLAADLLAAGTEVIAPADAGEMPSPVCVAAAAVNHPGETAELIEYRSLSSPDSLALQRGIPRLSLKGFFLPANEVLFRWRRHGAEVEVRHPTLQQDPRVVLGAKPCDAAALTIVDRVMNWDYADDHWNARRAATTVLSLACPMEDETCFCTAVGLGPDDPRGADGLLTPVDGGYELRVTTEKGEALVEACRGRFTEGGDAGAAERFRAEARARVAANLTIDAAAVHEWIATHFDDPLLAALGVRCNGCGACASVCPTCHCFDIVDEPQTVDRGCRRRQWDTCQTGKFTLHASGHNPRADQNARFRQRINHKFAIYPLRFGEVLCTGCGRCARACHAGQDLVEILGAIDLATRVDTPAAGAPALTSEAAAAAEGVP